VFKVAIPWDVRQQKERLYWKGVGKWRQLAGEKNISRISEGSVRGKYLFVRSIPRKYIREVGWRIEGSDAKTAKFAS
jgi:hypothetical protein